MTTIQLFAVTEQGVQPLPVPEQATGFTDLYDGLAVGVYSALRTYEHNKFLCLEDHLARTERSMALLGWQFELDRAQLRQALHEVCTAYPAPDSRVRFDILTEPARQLDTASRVLIALMPLTPIPNHFYKEGVAVGFAPDLSRENPLAKTADFVRKRRAYAAGTQDCFDYLLVDKNGCILEGTSSNFFGIRDGIAYTAAEGMLEGITRKLILDKLLPQLDIPLRLELVCVTDIPDLDEAALSGSSRAFLPVVKIGAQVVGNGRPGPISQRILMAYNELVQRSVKTAV
jgi:branched-subunit amino acid aminotransferase/4-amino-4-deoxychorismate lyase